MAENEWVCLGLFHPYKWSLITVLTTGVWDHLVPFGNHHDIRFRFHVFPCIAGPNTELLRIFFGTKMYLQQVGQCLVENSGEFTGF